MIRITIEKNTDNVKIQSVGHAGFSKDGNDIVCAAVSTLICTWAQYAVDNLNVKCMDMKKGYAYIDVEDVNGKAVEPFKMLVCGLEALSEQYFENLHLEWGEIKKITL